MLRTLLLDVSLVVATLCAVGSATIIGRPRLTELQAELRPRLRESAPYLGVLVIVLAANSAIRDYGKQLSRLIGVDITYLLADLDFGIVAAVQSVQTELLTEYFSVIYVYGYVFVLVFPVLAYAALSDRKPFQRLLVAYSLNYLIGLVLYIIFIAYGPRNYIPGLYENLLYDTNAQYQFLTSEVNNPTNVFPSLHTSLSATVAIFAYRTRQEYPEWVVVATALAVSIIISTMYLGIHWATDVVFGIGLAGLSVYLADNYID